MKNKQPYTNTKVENNVIYREFSSDINELDLIWHKDAKDRIVEALEPTDWLFQFDNQLPVSFEEPIFIPREHIHRTIKGTGTLKLKITEL